MNNATGADMVNKPRHYCKTVRGKEYECKDSIKIMVAGLVGVKAAYMGYIVKYLWRFPYKGKPLEDLRKARKYLDFLIEEVEQDDKDREP